MKIFSLLREGHPAYAIMLTHTFLWALVTEANVIRLPLGNVNGIPCAGFPGVVKYLGIPYALPPLGQLRFSPPLTYNVAYPEPYLNATTNPPECIQSTTPGHPQHDASEDCLYLSVWAPENATWGSLPVRAYIHGGAFHGGSITAPSHDGCSSVSHSNVILVQMQYRLGSLGFLAHPKTYDESGTTGVWGIMDQQLALKWVKQNIGAFGGNSTNVLLNGQSAGAWSVAIHLAIPSSSGLFSSAIVQSAPARPLATPQRAYRVTKQFLVKLGCNSSTTLDEELECLRNTPAEILSSAEPSFSLLYVSDPAWEVFFPIVDGYVIPNQLVESFASGNFNKVPVMMGFNLNEGNQPITMMYHNTDNLTYSDILTFLTNMHLGGQSFAILDLYADFVYLEGNPYYQLYAALWTDVFMSCPMFNMLSNIQSYGVFTYAYNFLHTPSCPASSKTMGAYHGAEEIFVFDHVEMMDSDTQTSDACVHTPEEAELAKQMVAVWANMAAVGQPMLANGSIWQNWETSTQRFTLIEAGNMMTMKIDLASKCSLLSSLSA